MRLTALALVLAGVTAGPSAAQPMSEPTVYAGPNAVTFGYLNEEVTIAEGGTLSIESFDFVDHTVTSAVFDEEGFPIFGSDATGFRERNRVHGVELLAPGTYTFFCIFHSNLHGTLTVDPRATEDQRPKGGVR